MDARRCEQCKNEFTKKGRPGRFCSRECLYESMRAQRPAKPCVVCQKPVEPIGSEGLEKWSKRNYCSQRCYWDSRRGVERPELRRRVQRVCAACGIEYEAGGRSAHRNASTFCSRLCAANAKWRTGSRAKDLTVAQAAYLAGIIDGEGSIMLYRREKGAAMRVTVANTNRALLDWCATVCGVGNIVMTERSNPKHKPSGMWHVNSQAAASLLEQTRPYLVIKGEQADVAIEFQRKLKVPAAKAEKEWQEQWRLRMRAMNARGPRTV